MTIYTFALILLSTLCSTVAQVLLKKGMSRAGFSEALAEARYVDTVLWLFKNGWVFSGLSLYFAGALVWLVVLSRIEVSQAYPFVGLGFVLTALLGWWVFGDNVSLTRLSGTFLIVLGVFLVAKS